MSDLKQKRQKLREKRKPSKGATSTTTGQNTDAADDDNLEDEQECEEDDCDDDYDYFEDKLLSQNNLNAGGGPGVGQSEKQVLQNLINGDSADKSLRKQRIWKKDFLR